MRITYHRTGGLLTLLFLGVVGLAATVVTVAAAAALLIVGVAGAAVLLLARALLPRSWRRQTVAPTTSGPQDIIEGTVVHTAEDKE